MKRDNIFNVPLLMMSEAFEWAFNRPYILIPLGVLGFALSHYGLSESSPVLDCVSAGILWTGIFISPLCYSTREADGDTVVTRFGCLWLLLLPPLFLVTVAVVFGAFLG